MDKFTLIEKIKKIVEGLVAKIPAEVKQIIGLIFPRIFYLIFRGVLLTIGAFIGLLVGANKEEITSSLTKLWEYLFGG